ncbi:hypothetical protein VCJ_002362 [Vibrio metoecus]|nr:hypothetical protein VCJ_002362 [Vibrio metoecus]
MVESLIRINKQGLFNFKYHLDQDEQNSLSSSFQKQISDWYHSVSQALKYPLWREVGELAGGVQLAVRLLAYIFCHDGYTRLTR